MTTPNSPTEPKEPHARLTLEEVKDLWRSGALRASGYLYLIIKAQRRNGWRFRIQSINEFCKEFEIGRPTFYKAKAKLIHEGKMQEDISGTVDLWIPSNDYDISVLDPVSPNGDTDTVTVSLNVDSVSPNGDSESPIGDSQSPNGDNDPIKSFDFIESWRSYRSLTDLLQISLSQEQESEIENLIKFVASCNPGVRSPRPYSRKALDSDFHHWLNRYEQSLKTREEINVPPRAAPVVENFSALEMEIRQVEREWAIATGNTRHRQAIAELITKKPELGLRVEDDRLVRVEAAS